MHDIHALGANPEPVGEHEEAVPGSLPLEQATVSHGMGGFHVGVSGPGTLR